MGIWRAHPPNPCKHAIMRYCNDSAMFESSNYDALLPQLMSAESVLTVQPHQSAPISLRRRLHHHLPLVLLLLPQLALLLQARPPVPC